MAYLGFSVDSLIPVPKSGMMENNNFPLVVKFPTFPHLFGLEISGFLCYRETWRGM